MTDPENLRIGLMLGPEADPADSVELAVQAEAQGFDFVACGEHVLFHVPTPNAFVTLAAVASRTARVRLLSALTVVPLYPAALLAKMATTLDRIAGGRFDLGIGVGGENPAEFAACGVPTSERGARTDESLDLCRHLFSGERGDFSGRFASVREQRLAPLPVQAGGPPLWIGGRSAASMRRAGRYGRYWFPYMLSPERLADGLHRVADAAEESGRPRTSVSGSVFAWGAVDRDPQAARRTAYSTLARVYRQDFESLPSSYIPHGTPQQVASHLREYVDAGARAVLFSPACPPGDVAVMTALFAEEVMPLLRDSPGAALAQNTGSAVSTASREGTR